jgi:hypothetical protein
MIRLVTTRFFNKSSVLVVLHDLYSERFSSILNQIDLVYKKGYNEYVHNRDTDRTVPA